VSVPDLRSGYASDRGLRDLVARGVEVIEAEQAATGAYPACPTYPVYRYAWLRDGSFVADGVGGHGRDASAHAFHEWVAGVITDRRAQIEDVVAATAAGREVDRAAFLPTRYTVDGREAGGDWWDFQLDGYGTWLWALDRHVARTGAVPAAFAEAGALVVRYLVASWDHPCFDWWEEHAEHVHVSTLASIAAGLRAAARGGVVAGPAAELAARTATAVTARIEREGRVDGRLRKWLGSTAVDASTLAAVSPFAVVDTATGAATVAAVEDALLDGGGVHRFAADVFYGGGRWPVLAGLLGQAYAAAGRVDEARGQLAWIAGTADGDGLLPEQVSDRLLAPEHLGTWVERWGPVARPLLWSHGGYLALAADLGIRA
jgi:GH15 family glucan-1,4-alpha-glucosidase